MTDVQMDYDLMEEMAQIFREGAHQMDDLVRTMQGVAQSLEDGALLGRGGELLASAIRDRLNGRIARLQDKLEELSQDVYGALIDLRDGDKTAASRFKD
jgi:uncharacterized protein YukE